MEFENGGLSPKKHQMFSVRITPGEWKKSSNQSPVILDFVWRKHGQGNHVIIVTSSFPKSSIFFKMFSVHMETKSQRFQISQVWRALSKKLHFREGLVRTVGLSAEITEGSSSCVAWTLSNFYKKLCRRKLQMKSLVASSICSTRVNVIFDIGRACAELHQNETENLAPFQRATLTRIGENGAINFSCFLKQ